MLRYALLAIGAALLVAVAFVMLPVHTGPRPEPRSITAADAPPATSFTVRDAGPVAPTPPAANPPAASPPADASATAPASPGDLDAVMQRLRAASGTPAPAPAATPQPAPTPPAASPTPTPSPPAATDTAATPPPSPPSRWGSVTGQGTRWRMARSNSGYVVSIDLGGGNVADVHVLPAFANLDPSAVNVRVDYLKDTILQNFSNQSGQYSFARDGSVSLMH